MLTIINSFCTTITSRAGGDNLIPNAVFREMSWKDVYIRKEIKLRIKIFDWLLHKDEELIICWSFCFLKRRSMLNMLFSEEKMTTYM